MGEWSEWRPFPDPRREGYLQAPFGPGVYELRNRETGELVLPGSGKNCALRMTSLLPAPLGQGTRLNAKKREYVLAHLVALEYRTRALATSAAAKAFEDEIRRTGSYLFPT